MAYLLINTKRCSPCSGSEEIDVLVQDERNVAILLQYCCTLGCCLACMQTSLTKMHYASSQDFSPV